MPITAIAVLGVRDMALLLVFGAPCQLRLLAGQEHGRTIPLPDIDFHAQMRYTEVALGVQSDRGEPERWSEKVF
jgi:hypothetical protein